MKKNTKIFNFHILKGTCFLTFSCLLFLMLCLFFSGCGDKKENKQVQSRTFVTEKNAVKFTVTVSAEKISVADILKVDFEVEAPEDLKLQLPSKETNAGEFEIINESPEKRKIISENRVNITKTMELAPFLSGKKKIPGFKLQAEGKKKFSLQSHDIEIDVLSSFAGDIPKKLNGIAPPKAYPKSYIAIYVAAAILAVAIIIYLIWRFKFRKVQSEVIVKTPYEIAIQQLAALREKGLVDKGLIKEFYSEVSDILRLYIERRFMLRAPELTTEEFMDQLRNSDKLTIEYKNLLREFLSHCDMVKFAGLTPSGTDIVNTIESCEKFIEETKPVVTDKNEGENDAA